MHNLSRIIIIAAALLAGATTSALAEEPHLDWTSPDGQFGLSYKDLNWEESPADGWLFRIAAIEQPFLFCDVASISAPAFAGASQDELTRFMRYKAGQYQIGDVSDDALGGSRLVQSALHMAGKVAVHRVVYETLDQARPILRTEIADFVIGSGDNVKLVQISCMVGYGSDEARRPEITRIIDSLRIKGAAASPP